MLSVHEMLLSHLRFLFLPAIQLLTIFSMFLGGSWLWLGFCVYITLTLAVDEIAGDTDVASQKINSRFHDSVLYLTVLLMIAEMLLLAWYLGEREFQILRSTELEFLYLDLTAAREASLPVHIVGLILSIGFTLAGAAGGGGHELMHRTQSKFDFFMGRLVLSLCCYSSFMFEHVYGHHRNVGFSNDSGTAQRGCSLWLHIFKSIKNSHINAFDYEKKRLARKGKYWFHPHNRVLIGHVYAAIVLILFCMSAGWIGLIGYLMTAWVAISLIEAFSYLGHYGLVRAPNAPIEPRHSWNSYKGVLSGLLFNLPRHSNHHKSAQRKYWQLEKEPDAPIMPLSISLMAFVAMFPPLFFRLMESSLDHWDQNLASAEEIEILSSRYQ